MNANQTSDKPAMPEPPSEAAVQCSALLAANLKMKKAIQEAMAEIHYQYKDMLTAHERNHPRGSGWGRVYDRLKQSISS